MSSNPFIGAWQLVSGECGEPGEEVIVYDMNELASRKVISDQQFSFVTLKSGAFYSAASGDYTFDAEQYHEKPVLASYAPMMGQTYTFKHRIEGDLWHNERYEGDRRIEHEIWQRIG